MLSSILLTPGITVEYAKGSRSRDYIGKQDFIFV